jgi:hypothetical protein
MWLPEMQSEREIGEAIAAQIKIAAPLAVVWRRDMLGQNAATDWNAIMRSPDDENRIHGWMVKRVGMPTTEEMSNHISAEPRYQILGSHYHYIGTDDDNSYDKFNAEINAIVTQFGLNDPSLPAHGQVQFQLIQMFNSGAELIHFAAGELVLYIC